MQCAYVRSCKPVQHFNGCWPPCVFLWAQCASLVLGAKLGVLPACLPAPSWVTLGATGAPAQYPGSSVALLFFFFTSPRTAAFTRARQTDPLRAIKPSKREQRGQVLGGLH